MVSLLPMCRHLHRCCNGLVALIAMASSLLMRRLFAGVDDDGDGATGDSIDDNCDSVTNINNDDNGATDDDINDNNCDGQWL
jgi:hypothetical protein